VSNRLGVSALVGQSTWRQQRLLILCYHGVSLRDEHEWDPELYVSPATFARRLELIRKRRCHVLGLGEALERLDRRDLPERSVVLTFDDGYFDFLARARPLLMEYAFPATVYLTTQRCEHNFPIVTLCLSYVLWKRRDAALDGSGLPGLDATRYPLATAAHREHVRGRLIRATATTRPAAKDEMVREIAGRLGVDYDDLVRARMLTLMNPAEVRELAAVGVDFQLHTHRHRTPDDPDAFAREIVENRDRIVRITGRHPSHFCYPSGIHRAGYPLVLQREGVRSATTCRQGFAHRASDALLLPRVLDTGAMSDEEFEGWLTGAAAWMPRRTRSAPVSEAPG
jgi:peptidoglycan/xylan/chitin deacetylase (PgdA/CDA1 family)